VENEDQDERTISKCTVRCGYYNIRLDAAQIKFVKYMACAVCEEMIRTDIY